MTKDSIPEKKDSTQFRDLIEGLMEITQGHFSHRMKVVNDGSEYGSLINLFNTMSRELEELFDGMTEKKLLDWKVDSLCETLEQISAGDFSARTYHTKDRHPVDVLSYMIDSLAEELEKAFKQIEQQKQYQEEITNSIPDLLVIVNENDSIQDVNPAVTKLLGFPANQLVGNSLDKIFHKKRKLKKGQKSREENYLLDQSENQIPVSVSESDLHGEALKGGRVLIFRDIRETLHLEEERLEAVAQMNQAQKVEALGILADGVAHDMNNILMGMLSAMDALGDEIPKDSSLRTELMHLNILRKRGTDLVKQILTFSRRDKMNRTAVKVSDILLESLEMLRASTPSTVKIVKKVEIPQAEVMGNASQLHQVIVNLCVNAVHAMEEKGGYLSVNLGLTTKEEITELQLPGNSKWLCLKIEDTGTGMDEETIKKIFDPFFTTKAQGKGTGLGLSVIDGIIEMHEGKIRVKSTPGEGSTFAVYLPVLRLESLKSRSPKKSRKKKSKTLQQGPKLKILFVDDEELIRIGQKKALEKLGHHVDVSVSAINALETLEAHADDYDLIISDQTMPKMKGTDFSQVCQEKWPDLPFILATGFNQENLADELFTFGICSMLHKPYERVELEAVFEKVIDGVLCENCDGVNGSGCLKVHQLKKPATEKN